MKALWLVCESIRERNYRLRKRIIYLGLQMTKELTLTKRRCLKIPKQLRNWELKREEGIASFPGSPLASTKGESLGTRLGRVSVQNVFSASYTMYGTY